MKTPVLEGLFWAVMGFLPGERLHELYINSLEVIEAASKYIEDKIVINSSVFGGQKIKSLPEDKRKDKAAQLAPILRGLCSSENAMIGHFTDNDKVLEYINSKDLERLAPMGTSCPDHFLRTKIKPLILNLSPEQDLSDEQLVLDKISDSFEQYRNDYREYYESCKHKDSPAVRDPNPVVILYPGVGMFTFCRINKQPG